MMKFRTELAPEAAPLQLNYGAGVVALGSCFAARIGERLAGARLPTCINPLGIVYNPLSACRLLRIALGDAPWPAATYAPHLEAWHSFDLHSQCNAPDRETFQRGVEQGFAQLRQALARAEVLILTFGTALVYRRHDSGEVVNNCHRYPAAFFTRDLLTLPDTLEAMYELVRRLRAQYPQLQLLLTVSPVRHVREGLPLNSVSKATLRLLCHQLASSLPEVHYYPAYELMVDDLRDYRFYGADLIHPNDVAEQYIWEHFCATHLSPAARAVLTRWEQVQRDLAHRPRQPGSQAHRRFLQQLRDKLLALSTSLDCSAELAQVEAQLG